MASSVDLALYDSLGAPQSATPATGKVDQSHLDLYDSMRNEDQADLSKVTAPGNPADIVAARRAGRPDLLSKAGETLMNGGQPISPAGAAVAGLEGVGGVTQKLESGQANAMNELLPGNKVQGDTTNLEVGDVLASRGVPDPAASLGGLVLSTASMAGPGKVIDYLTSAANSIRANLVKAGVKSAIPQTARILFNKPIAETKYLVDNPEALSKANVSEGAPQKVANNIARDIVAVQRKGTRLYQKAAKNSADIELSPQTSYLHGQELSDILSKEGDPQQVQKILNTPIGKAPVSKTTTTHTYKPGFAMDQESGQIVSRPDYQQVIGQADPGKNTQVTSKMTPIGPVTTKITKTEQLTEKAGAEQTAESTYTLKDLLARAQTGKPITTRELVAARNTLQKLRETSGTAGQMSDAILERLGQADPTYTKAAATWKDYKRAEEYGNQLFGGIFRDPSAVSREARVSAATGAGDKISKIFSNPNTPLAAAPSELDAIFSRNLKGRDYTKQVHDVAAASGMGDIRPRLFGSTIGGSVASVGIPVAAAAGASVISPALSLIPLLAIAGGTPRVNALIIRGLAKNKVLNQKSATFLASPAGRFLQGSGVVASAATKQAGRNAILRQATGQNEATEQTQ